MCARARVLDSLTLTNSNLLPFINELGFGELLLNKTIKQFYIQLLPYIIQGIEKKKRILSLPLGTNCPENAYFQILIWCLLCLNNDKVSGGFVKR